MMIEYTKQYAASGFPELADAWSFVMDHIDEVGNDPSIEIVPFWEMNPDGSDIGARYFSVKVAGTVEVESGSHS